MEFLIEIVALTAVVVAVSAAARKVSVPSPIVIVLVGLALSFLPGAPVPELEPEFILIGVLPPLLYVAALETSVPDFRFNLRPILLLAVGLVLFTTFAVGLVVHALMPSVPLSICLALGAVVAPPDAIAATAVARRIGLPRRIVTILEGESLLNDATALVVFRVAVLASIGAVVGPREIAGQALLAGGGGVLVGAVGAVILGYFHRRTTDPLLDNAISLLAPFVVTAAAEAVHASAVVAVVVTGLYLGHRLHTLMSAASRLQMGAFWRMVKFLLEGLVFLLVGLQVRHVLADLNAPPQTVVGVTAAVLATVIVARFVWVYPSTYLPRRIPAIRRRDPPPPWTVPTVVAWAGMRGVVTLATALALPVTLAGDVPYPRELFVWLAFAVIMGTLLLQGMTLPAFARRLRLPADDPMKDVLAEAATQQAASRAARAALEQHAGGAPPQVVERLRGLTEQRSNTAWERLGGDRETPSQAYVRLRRSCWRRSGRSSAPPGTRAASPKRCWSARSGTWTWRNHCWSGVTKVELMSCAHLAAQGVDPADDPTPQHAAGCADCEALGLDDWVHLRLCLTCGYVGCCDSSPRRHASGHYEHTEHAVMRSFQPGEAWRWCFVDEVVG